MYRVTKDGETLAIVEHPRFVRVHPNGCFVQAEECVEDTNFSPEDYPTAWRMHDAREV